MPNMAWHGGCISLEHTRNHAANNKDHHMTRTLSIFVFAAFSTAALASTSLSSVSSLSTAASDPVKAQEACREAFAEGTDECRDWYKDAPEDLAICLEGVRIAYYACMEAAAENVARMVMDGDDATLSMNDLTGEADSVDLYITGKDGRDRFIGSADVGRDGTVRVRIQAEDARRIKPNRRVVAVWFSGDEIVSERDVKVLR